MSNSLKLQELQHTRLPCPSLSPRVCWNSSIESVMPSNHLDLCCPLLLLPSVFPSIRVFSNELVLNIMWPKYWNFNFSISPSNEYSGLISFRIDCFYLLAVQGTLKSLLQHHNWRASILRHSAFFMVQLSNFHTWLLEKSLLWLYGPLLAKWCLRFYYTNFVIAFLPRSKHILILWLQSLMQWFWSLPK